jgi:tRNA threonylcarbamoyladenosine biosynthesis protein TsaB
MLSIALETSHRSASVAMEWNGQLTELHLDPEAAHASDCLGLIANWFQERELSPQSIERIVVGTGPGSYTGLRIGIATALGLARGAASEAMGVPSGEALCWRELEPGTEAIYLLDARQNELYFAHYARTADDIEVRTAPCVVPVPEIEQVLPADLPIFGDRKALELAGLESCAQQRFKQVAPPNAAALLQLGSMRMEIHGAQALEDIEPLYLRPFAAKVRKR